MKGWGRILFVVAVLVGTWGCGQSLNGPVGFDVKQGWFHVCQMPTGEERAMGGARSDANCPNFVKSPLGTGGGGNFCDVVARASGDDCSTAQIFGAGKKTIYFDAVHDPGQTELTELTLGPVELFTCTNWEMTETGTGVPVGQWAEIDSTVQLKALDEEVATLEFGGSDLRGEVLLERCP